MKGEKTRAELEQQFDVHPNLITQWRARLLESAADVFGAEASVGARRALEQLAKDLDVTADHEERREWKSR